MGCWNKTCGFSGLPIFRGNPVYVFILEKQEGLSEGLYNPCYSDSEYTPVLCPFESTYDEYGGGGNSKGVWLPYLIEALREKLIEKEEGESSHRHLAVLRENFGEEQFFSSVWADRLDISIYGSKGARIRFTMMHKSIVDLMLDKFPFNDHYSRYKDYKFKKILPRIPAYWEYLKEEYNKESEPVVIDSKTFQGMNKLLFDFRLLTEFKEINRLMDPSFHGGTSATLIQYPVFFKNCLENSTEDSVVIPLLQDFVKGCYINTMMSSLRKTWLPGGYEGSQESDFRPYRLLNRVTGAFMRGCEREMDY